MGLIVLRSDVNFKTIKKDQSYQKSLNESPRIFLVGNFLNVVTPSVVGFFTNMCPRPDMPETFEERLKQFIGPYNEDLKYQVEFGPIWAPGHRMNVFKLMAAYEDKEELRIIMENFPSHNDTDSYICMTEYGSLPVEQKIKTIRCQVEYASTYRSLFIQGYKSIQGPLREGANEADDVAGTYPVAYWIFNRETSYGKQMFTRVYEATGGSVELHTHKNTYKEATDWARLATSEIATQLNNASMKSVFWDPADADTLRATQPVWKPHTLSARVERLAEPQIIDNPRRRRDTVSIDYSMTNSKKKGTQPARAATPQANNPRTPQGRGSHAGRGGGGVTPSTTTYNYTTKQVVTQEEQPMTTTHEIKKNPINSTETTNKAAGINRYNQQVTDVADKRLGILERQMAQLAAAQAETNKSINKVATGQKINNQNITKLIAAVGHNKQDADNKHHHSATAINNIQQSLTDIAAYVQTFNANTAPQATNPQTTHQNHNNPSSTIAPPPNRGNSNRPPGEPPMSQLANLGNMSTELFDTYEEFGDQEYDHDELKNEVSHLNNNDSKATLK